MIATTLSAPGRLAAVLRTALLVGALAPLGACAAGRAGAESTPIADEASGMAPAPYTAAAIRDANPPGTRIVFRVKQAGEPIAFQAITFVGGDRERAVLEAVSNTEEGLPVDGPSRTEAPWEELRSHGSFPAQATTVTDAPCAVHAGRFECMLYTVVAEEQGVLTTSRFWFARSRPGPPVLYEVERAGEVIFRMELVRDSRGG